MNLQRYIGEVSSTTDGTASKIAELCPQCSTVDIAALFESPMRLFPLPTLQSMILNTTCPLCKLCSKAIRTIWNMSSEDISGLRTIRCWLRNALWAENSIMCGMLGTDWKPGQHDSPYMRDTVRYFTTTLHLVLDDQENALVPDSVEELSHEASDTRDGREALPNRELPLLPFYSKYNKRLFRRRVIPEQVDISLLRSWIHECQQNHPHTRSQTMLDLSQLGVAHFRVIDVCDCRLVELEVSCRFVALSYVWGNCTQPALVLDENNSFIVEGLPRTIRDAIHLTRLLRERYLWVDSICIDQDNPEDKHALVSCMDRIYESACLTIVAAGGNDANAGLPGISPHSRATEIVENIPINGQFVQIALGRPSLRALVEDTYWNTRGWTYQEHILSKCCLFFTDTEVFYSCLYHGPRYETGVIEPRSDFYYGQTYLNQYFRYSQLNEWREGYILETRDLPTCYQSILPWGSSWERTPDPIVRAEAIPRGQTPLTRLEKYTEAVSSYTKRQLAYKADIIAAFAGIISSIWPGEDHAPALEHGLPVESLPFALLWEPVEAGQLSRRIIHDSVISSRSRIFPSWSWAGWIGLVRYPFRYLRVQGHEDKLEYTPLTEIKRNWPIQLRPFFTLEQIGLHDARLRYIPPNDAPQTQNTSEEWSQMLLEWNQYLQSNHKDIDPGKMNPTSPTLSLLTRSVYTSSPNWEFSLEGKTGILECRTGIYLSGNNRYSETCIQVVLDNIETAQSIKSGDHICKLIAISCGDTSPISVSFERTRDRVSGLEPKDFVVMLVVKVDGHYHERIGIGVVETSIWYSLGGEIEWTILR
ncbi:HET domain containing protein [Hyaloscypha variabilis]